MAEIVQGSPEWHAIRLGKVTASRVADATDFLKSGKPGAKRVTYMGELIAERLTGLAVERFQNNLMRWGTEQEPQARALYEFYRDVDVEMVAFVPHPTIPMAGCSPDGLVGSEGLIEIKAPGTSTHIDTLLAQEIPEEYVKQMLWQISCTGRSWCDFASYAPRLPPHMSLFVKRLEPSAEDIAFLEIEVREFIAEIDAKVQRLTTLYPNSAQSSAEGDREAGAPLAASRSSLLEGAL